MPLLAYAFVVGGVLLASLFTADALLPPPAQTGERPLQANIRVKSQFKGPDAVVFSGHPIDYGVKPSFEVTDFSARAADPKAQAFAHASPHELREAAPLLTKVATQRMRKPAVRRAAPAPARPPQFEPWTAPSFNVVGNFRD